MKNGYAVVWTGGGARETYEIESRHRTLAAAERRARKILAGNQRVNGPNCGSFSRVFAIRDGRIAEEVGKS